MLDNGNFAPHLAWMKRTHPFPTGYDIVLQNTDERQWHAERKYPKNFRVAHQNIQASPNIQKVNLPMMQPMYPPYHF